MPRGVYERTEQHRAAIREGQRDRKPLSEESRAKLSRSLKLVEHTPEWSAKISAAKTGKVVPALRGPRLGSRTDKPTYRTAHARVHNDRGPARTHPCVDCGNGAIHWSFSWRRVARDLWMWTPDRKRPFTGNPDDYDSRCASCATRYDMAGYEGGQDAAGR